jgi:hypothetical protein
MIRESSYAIHLLFIYYFRASNHGATLLLLFISLRLYSLTPHISALRGPRYSHSFHLQLISLKGPLESQLGSPIE